VASARSLAAFAAPAALAGAVFGLLAFVLQPQDRQSSDFYSFWSGARLVGPHLYDPAQVERIERQVAPQIEVKRYIRPPFYAVALWPLGKLPFHTAYVVWFVVNLAAALAFVWAWRFQAASYLACALFFPLGWSFGAGQDAPLMLATAAFGARLIERKKDAAGGLLLALGAIKPHLFLFVPVMLVAQRRWRALAGMLAGGAVLFLVSAAVLGFAWPAPFLRAAMANEDIIRPNLLGLAGVLGRMGMPRWLLATAALAGGILVYRWTRSAAWRPSVAIAIAVGVVVSPRSMVYDASLFLPLLLERFSAAVVSASGFALASVVTPAALMSQLTSLALIGAGRPSRATARTDPGAAVCPGRAAV
jgi:hypothetical protein